MNKESINKVLHSPEENKEAKLEKFNQERYGEDGLALKTKLEKMPDDFELLLSFNDQGVKLKEKYGSEYCIKIMAFHILVGSTPKAGFLESKENKFDFDGEDSVEKFINKTIEELRNGEK